MVTFSRPYIDEEPDLESRPHELLHNLPHGLVKSRHRLPKGRYRSIKGRHHYSQ